MALQKSEHPRVGTRLAAVLDGGVVEGNACRDCLVLEVAMV